MSALQKFSACSALAIMVAGVAAPASAQEAEANGDQFQEIIVTAQKRGESIQKVPMAIAAIGGEELQRRGVRNALDLTQNVPGLQINTLYQSSNPTIFLRGVGVNDYDAASSGSVGVTVDDVFLNSSVGLLAQVYDLDRVEVLKGPQGTLYGRNTTGGVINYHTKRPTFDTDMSMDLTYGRYNQVSLVGGIGGALVDDKLAARISLSVNRRNGWATNVSDGGQLNDIHNQAVRLQLLFKPNDRLTIENKIEGGESSTSAVAHKSLGTFNVAANRPCTGDEILRVNLCANPFTGYVESGDLNKYNTYLHDNFEKLENFGDRLLVNWEGDAISVTSVSAYVRNVRKLNQSQDFSPVSLLQSPQWKEVAEQYSQELRVSSNGDGRVKWVAGAYYLHERLNVFTDFSLLRGFNPTPTVPYFDPVASILTVERETTQITDSYALFGQLDYEVTDDLTVTAGLRYTIDNKDLAHRSVGGPVNPDSNPRARLTDFRVGFIDADLTNSTVDGPIRVKSKLRKPTWRLAAKYQVNPDLNIFASYSRGVRAGGYNTGALFQIAEFAPVTSERLDAFEVGFKSDLLGRRLRINASGFYYDYKNMQVFSLESAPNGQPIQRLQNADAEIYGGELEISARPFHGLELNGSLAYTHARYKDFIDPVRGSFNGKQLDKTPELQLNAGARYTAALSGSVDGIIGADYAYQTEVFFSPENKAPLRSAPHGQLNLDAGLNFKDIGLNARFWMKNVTNKRFLADNLDFSSLGFWFGIYNEPRTYGLTLSYRM